MAQAYGKMGRVEEGFATLERWLGLSSNRLFPALDQTLCRIRGELLSKAGSTVEAEQYLRRAIELSASQSAKIEQLRSTTALTRLLITLGRRDEGGSLLAEIYGWFSEGFDTTDLREAKTLLDDLARSRAPFGNAFDVAASLSLISDRNLASRGVLQKVSLAK